MGARRWIVAAAAGLAVAIAVIGAALLVGRLAEPAKAPVVLDLPRPGETRADYLPDGTPVWVVGHADGSVDVFSAISTHLTFGVQQLTWWCPASRAVEEPSSQSAWTEYGVKVAGPAPSDLTHWSAAVHGDKVLIGDRALGAPARAATTARQHCTSDDDVTVHTFEGWRQWTSPLEALAHDREGWILLAGALVRPSATTVVICSLTGCADSAIPYGVGPLRTSLSEFDGLPDQLFIVKVRGGRLTELTRVVVLSGS